MPCDALYLHIPFCLRKCPYCDFYSVDADPSLMDAYTEAVLCAFAQAPFDLAPLDTVYFGGGTPSAFGGERLARLLDGVRCRDHGRVQPMFRPAGHPFPPMGCGGQPSLAGDAER